MSGQAAVDHHDASTKTTPHFTQHKRERGRALVSPRVSVPHCPSAHPAAGRHRQRGPRSMRPQLWRLPAFSRIGTRHHTHIASRYEPYCSVTPVCLAQDSLECEGKDHKVAAWPRSDRVRRGYTTRDAVLILGAVSTPSPPPSGHLLRDGSRGGRGRGGLHVPEWMPHRKIKE